MSTTNWKIVQIPIKIRILRNLQLSAELQVPASAGKEGLERLALASDVAEKWLEGAAPRRVIVVPGKLVNLVP